jgi:hypothetical protein
MHKLLGISAAALLVGWAGHAAAQTEDDYGAVPAESGQVAVGGGAQTGTLETAGDVDWFAVDLTQGQQYQIDLEGEPTAQGTLSDPRVEVLGPNGNVVAGDDDGGTGFNSRLRFTAGQTGTFYVAAGAFGSATGTYSVTVEEYTPPPDDFAGSVDTEGTVSVGGSATGEIGHDGDLDWFAVDLSAGQSYAIDLEGDPTGAGSLSDPYLHLYDADGREIDFNDDGGQGFNSRLIFTPDRAGRYYVGAGAFGSATGTYRVSVAEYTPPPDDYAADQSTEGQLAVGGAAEGELEVAGDSDWFAIRLEAGVPYVFTLEGARTGNPLNDPYLSLYDEGGSMLSSNDDHGGSFNSRIEYTPNRSGRFFLEASGFGDNTGVYVLAARQAQGGDMQFGEVGPGAAAEGDNIAVILELESGERITVLVPRDYLSEIGSVYIGPQ